jgi:tRNA (guanine37-N1)-methyltransferase
MPVPCVRVEPSAGETTRARLAERDLVADEYEITVEDGWLYVPVVDPSRVPAEYDVHTRELPSRRTQTMPAELCSFEPSYERLGDIAIVDEDDPDRARELADAIANSDLPVESVLNRASKVKGEQRVRDWEVLAGAATETVHREYGCEFLLDLDSVYFSPRLATERHRVVEQVAPGEQALDMFAGVGPFAIPFAVAGATVVGVDVNPAAIEYLETNARRNDVADRVTAIEGDVRAVTDEYRNWADRLVMNLPHSADEFLDAAIALAADQCVLHYYDIQPDDAPFEPGIEAIEAAAGTEYDVFVETKREVRSYAPREVNVCLDVRLDRP